MQKTQLELQMDICPCVIIKVIKPWHSLANDLAQLVNIFKEHVVVSHGPTRPGNLHSPPKKSVQTVNIGGLQRRDFRVARIRGEREHWQPTLTLSKFRWTKTMIDSCLFWREKYPLVVRLTVVSARSDWFTLPHLLLPLSRPP